MGNDLETSEVLYFTSFCIKSKEGQAEIPVHGFLEKC